MCTYLGGKSKTFYWCQALVEGNNFYTPDFPSLTNFSAIDQHHDEYKAINLLWVICY